MTRIRGLSKAGWLLAAALVLAAAAQEPKAPAGKPAPAAPAATPTVDQILQKYVDAVGGKAAIEKVTSRAAKGSFDVEGQEVSGTIETYAKAPNKSVSIVDIPGFGQVRQGFDGTSGWVSNPQGMHVMEGQELSVARRTAELHQILKLREMYPNMTLKGKEKVGDRETYVIEADPSDGSLRRMYIDTETSLLLRNDIERDTPMGRTTSESYLSDYREADGVKFPFSLRQVNPGITFVVKLTELKHNVPGEDSRFAQPSTP
jgi:hypothetical protein